MKMELALYQALIAINVPEPKVEAVIQAMESDLHISLATKSDVALLRTELSQLEVKLTIRMGVMLSATIGILVAAMKFIQ